MLTHSKEHLDDLVDVIAGWRQAKRVVDSQTSDEIISRCINLKHPEVALSLIANRPKFGVDLTSLSVARNLLHSLCERAQEAAITDMELDPLPSVTSSPFNDVIFMAALYPQYRLAEVFNDPISTAMLLSLTRSSQDEAARQLEKDLLEISAVHPRGGPAVRVEATGKERRWAEQGLKDLPYTVEFA